MLIGLEHIDKIYRLGVEEIHALRDVAFAVAENEYVAVMGPSGSGKSTLMNIIGCLDRPTSGRYMLADRHIHALNGPALAGIRNRFIGFVFQSFELLPRLTALKNVELPLIYSNVGWSRRRQLAREALARVGLADRIHHRPNQLSGGEKQRVAIARALVGDPKILLADEPTGNLDSVTTGEILALFDRLRQEGQTIVMVTHEDDVACRASRIVRLRDGRICSDLRTEDDIRARSEEAPPPVGREASA